MVVQKIKSDIAGTVISVTVSEGQHVSRDDELLVLESMKMEMPVTAPQAGSIGAIHVQPGDVVEEGQDLVSIDT